MTFQDKYKTKMYKQSNVMYDNLKNSQYFKMYTSMKSTITIQVLNGKRRNTYIIVFKSKT